jgi:hypothetical protein
LKSQQAKLQMQNHRYLRAESLAKQVWEMVRNDDAPDVKKFLDIVPHGKTYLRVKCFLR